MRDIVLIPLSNDDSCVSFAIHIYHEFAGIDVYRGSIAVWSFSRGVKTTGRSNGRYGGERYAEKEGEEEGGGENAYRQTVLNV
jgi:hypothetical protein